MNKRLTLLTAASVAAFFGATQALASSPSKKPIAESHSHVNFSIEGIDARSNEFSSIVSVSNLDLTNAYTTASPDELDAKSTWGWAFNLGYTFDDQSDFNISYRNMKGKMNTATHAYSSVTQISSSGAADYTDGNVDPDPVGPGSQLRIGAAGAVIGYTATDNSFAFINGTDTLTEKAEVKYQQLNFDWGHTFKPAAGVYLHPYIGAAWRSIGYKDTVTFAFTGAFSTTDTDENYLSSGTVVATFGSDLTLNGENVAEASATSDPNIAVVGPTDSPTFVLDGTGISATPRGQYAYTENKTYDQTNLAAALPSYNSKFSGFGPRVGMDSLYAFGRYFGLVGGVAITMPYAKLKVTGTATAYTTRNLEAGGDATGVTTNQITGVNLQATTGTNTTTISSIDHKFIPEMEVHFGVKLASDVTVQDKVAAYLELGYRVIQDWSAVKNINLRGSETDPSAGAATSLWGNNGSGYSYSDITNFGPYLKAGITFGT